MKKYYDYQLADRNTFGISSKAAEFVEYYDVSELKDALRDMKLRKECGISGAACADSVAGKDMAGERSRLDYLFLGGGSNLLFTGDFAGTVFHGNIKDIEVVENNSDYSLVRVGAAVVWDDFVKWSLGNSLYGAENLSLIPGETGASAVQNIGAYGVEVSEIIEKVETVSVEDLSERVFTNSECRYSYRRSFFKENYNRYVVHHVVFRLNHRFVPVLKYKALQQEFSAVANSVSAGEIRDYVIEMRRNKLPDPSEIGNAGSFFMNPVVPREVFEVLAAEYPSLPFYRQCEMFKIPAAWLIEQCGWKGRRVGNAGVCSRQPLVLVNYGGASADEIISLSERIVSDVREKFGIVLHPEVQFV